VLTLVNKIIILGIKKVAIGQQIRHLREACGLSLGDLAKLCKISKAYLSQLENEHNARPSAEFALRICSALGCSVEALLGSKVNLLGVQTNGISVHLRALAREENLDTAALTMLSQISYNGRQPTSAEGWRTILEAIRKSTEGR
jgi:transcriptional regulator with XRE-family HTH domain